MTFGKKTLFSLLLGLDLLANVLELTHSNFLSTSTLVSFCTYLLLPGLLISLILRVRKISFWENLLFIVGFSIAFLEFGGLLLNILFPLFGINDPLAFQNLVIGFDISVSLLFVFAWLRTKSLVVQIHLPRHSASEKVVYALPLFFPILAALGAIVLNNGGSNILTLILLGAIAFYSLLLVLLRNKLPVDLYPYALFFIGVASLFTTSLRSWYITGHDIEIEYYVFKLTNTHHFWSMAFLQDAYNACLSITILPTIITNLFSIQDMYVYKVIFQILFATSPVLVFFILRNYTTPVFAFLSAFVFLSFPTFFTDMAMLNRQEIGFIFFGLVLYVMFNHNSELSFSMRRLLFIIFALGVIISHYSTNFVLLILVALVYILTLIISWPFVKHTFAFLFSKSPIKLKNAFPNTVFLSLPLLLILFGATFFWGTLYTRSSNHASSVVLEVVRSMFAPSSTNTRSGDLSASLFFAHKSNPQQDLQDFIIRIRQLEGDANTYDQSITNKYPSYIVQQEQIAPTPLGNALSSFHIPVFNIQAGLRVVAADIFQIFVLIGLLAIIFLKNKKLFDLQYLFLCFSSLFLLALIIVLPEISIEYGALRMFQQFLFFLSLPIILGMSSILFFIKEQKRTLLIGILAIILFLDLTGFIPHLTGFYYPQLPLDNSGLYYDAYYVKKSDILAIAWLSENNGNKELVVADLSGVGKMLSYGGIKAIDANFPALVPKDAYVYLGIADNKVVALDNSILIYNSDKPFLDATKDLVYNNGTVNIYK